MCISTSIASGLPICGPSCFPCPEYPLWSIVYYKKVKGGSGYKNLLALNKALLNKRLCGSSLLSGIICRVDLFVVCLG